MTISETQSSREQANGRYFKRLGFGVLGALGTLYGAEYLVAGTILTPVAPLVGVASLGLGAASAYGGYKAFQHSAELEATVENDHTREARVSKIGKYAAGAALLLTGVTVANTAFVSSVGFAAGVGLWASGVALGGWGIHKLRNSFSIEDVEEPITSEQRVAAMRQRADEATDGLRDVFDRYFGSRESGQTGQATRAA